MSISRYSASVRVGVGRLAMRTAPAPLVRILTDAPEDVGARASGLREPGVDAPLEHVERDRTGAEHDLVERAQIEARAEPRPRALAQLDDLELTELVRRRLSGVGDVAVDLVDDVELRLRGVVVEVR